MPSEHGLSDSTDIFSLSDRVLADKLLFVKEVRFAIHSPSQPGYLMYPLRLVSETGVVFGYADRECQPVMASNLP
jgi:hypothetical protein